MASALATVLDYITDARTLLQDTIAPYRYDDPSLLVAFNVTLLEGRRIRPDLFIFHKHGNRPKSYDTVSATDVPIESEFRLAFVYGTVAHALARDQEDVQDARSSSFMKVFYDLLIGIRSSGIAAAQPGAA